MTDCATIQITLTADFDTDMSELFNFADGMLINQSISRSGCEIELICYRTDAAENFETLLNEPYFDGISFSCKRLD